MDAFSGKMQYRYLEIVILWGRLFVLSETLSISNSIEYFV